MPPRLSELPDELIESLRCALTNCSVDTCALDSYWSVLVEKVLDKSQKTVPLSIAGAIAASLVNYGLHKLQVAYPPANMARSSSIQKNLIAIIGHAISRSTISSSAGFASKIGINMITGGSSLSVNLGSRVAAEIATKKVARYLPQYTGTNTDSWTYTVARASTSAVVGTLTYSFAHDYLQLPAISARIISASSSAISEQAFQYVFK